MMEISLLRTFLILKKQHKLREPLLQRRHHYLYALTDVGALFGTPEACLATYLRWRNRPYQFLGASGAAPEMPARVRGR